MPKIDLIKSKRLIMEPRKGDHTYGLYDLFCEKDLYTYIGRDIPPSAKWLEEGMKKMETLVDDDSNNILLAWVAKQKENLNPVGLFETTLEGDDAYIAYTVFKPYWGKNYAQEATQAMTEFVKKNYHFRRFIIELDTRNLSSLRIAQKLDFEFVKVINNTAFIDGLVSHEYQFEKLIY